MDQKKIIIIGSAAIAMFVVIGICIYALKNNSPNGLELILKNVTWHEAFGECNHLKRQMANIMNKNDSEAVYTFLKKHNLKTPSQIWLSSISIGKSDPSKIEDFSDIYSGEPFKSKSLTKGNVSVSIRHQGGYCLGTEFLPGGKFNHINGDCSHTKRYVLCMDH